MKVSEFRIGNYVSLSGVDTLTVIEINTLAFYSKDLVGNNYKNTWAEIEPIWLTEEWMIKLKFTEFNINFRTFFFIGNFKLELSHGSLYYKKMYISSVHQLQNLYFALTQKELTI